MRQLRAVLVGDPAMDELIMARLDVERRIRGIRRTMLRVLRAGEGLAKLGRERRALREALAERAIIVDLERALLALDDEPGERQ